MRPSGKARIPVARDWSQADRELPFPHANMCVRECPPGRMYPVTAPVGYHHPGPHTVTLTALGPYQDQSVRLRTKLMQQNLGRNVTGLVLAIVTSLPPTWHRPLLLDLPSRIRYRSEGKGGRQAEPPATPVTSSPVKDTMGPGHTAEADRALGIAQADSPGFWQSPSVRTAAICPPVYASWHTVILLYLALNLLYRTRIMTEYGVANGPQSVPKPT